jgi:ABC-type antimicrobial peptide transport system permease subunit
MAMGASHSHVLKMVLRQGLMLSLVGVVTGAVVSVFVGRLLTSVLAGLATPNPFAYGLVPITLIGMTIAASYVPARRAASIDPLRALRDE